MEAVRTPIGASQGLGYTRTILVVKDDDGGANFDVFLYSIYSKNSTRLGVRSGDILVIVGGNFYFSILSQILTKRPLRWETDPI